MIKIPCGGWGIGTGLKFINKVLSVGSDNMTLSDAGLEVSTGAQGDSLAVGCVENGTGDLVNGMRGTDDVHIYAGEGKEVAIGNDTYVGGTMTVDGDIIGDKQIVLTSSTSGSVKQFKITVNDSGTLTATEITE